MANFIGEFDCKIDAKGRFLFPSGLKKQLDPSAQELFVVNRGFEKCLVLWPLNIWEAETKKLNKLNLYKKKNREFVRRFNNGATQLNIDGNGRLLLPKRLMAYGDMMKEVVLKSFINKIEIWDKATHDEMMNNEEIDFADLAEEVMGDIEEDQD
ncbi:MAG: division/cell wall cluster transcriptional repressor MraZ [Flavobacteriales bacterium]|nr:division/cell wall cluster transcriptional repressor MraZ [Flavobacteriales bacterium]